jgi:signal transduction histidine kinase
MRKPSKAARFPVYYRIENADTNTDLPANGMAVTDVRKMTDDCLQSLQQALARRDRQIAAVHHISAALFSKTDLDSLLREVLGVSLESLDAAAGSIWLYDSDRRKLVCRNAYRGAENIVGMELDPDDPDANAALVLRTGTPLITDTRMRSHQRAIDDRTGFHTEKLLTVPLKNLGGDTIGVMQVLNKRNGLFDENDLEMMEIVGSLAATSIANVRLAEEVRLAAVARAVGDLGHDIKNALTPVETVVDITLGSFIAPMYVELDKILAQRRQSDPEMAQEIEAATESLREWHPEVQSAVRDGCADIRELVGGIADYIKGAQATNIEVGSIQEIVREKLRRLEVVAQNRMVTLHVEGIEDVPPFPFDRRLLGRALYNLVNNALGAVDDAVKRKALKLRPAGFNIWVRASAVQEGDFPAGNYCRIEVQDDGPGIPDRVKRVLFTPQAISTTPGGTGIGTRFVKSVADAHGGEVGVASELGQGARFWITLPLTPPNAL